MVTNGLFNWGNGQTVAFRHFTQRFTKEVAPYQKRKKKGRQIRRPTTRYVYVRLARLVGDSGITLLHQEIEHGLDDVLLIPPCTGILVVDCGTVRAVGEPLFEDVRYC